SAPIYDNLTAPQSFPRPVCIATTDSRLIHRTRRNMAVQVHEGTVTGCRCNSQQGTRLDVSFEFCMSVVTNGYFDDTRPDPAPVQQHLVNPPASPPAFQPENRQSGSSFTRVPYEKGRFL